MLINQNEKYEPQFHYWHSSGQTDRNLTHLFVVRKRSDFDGVLSALGSKDQVHGDTASRLNTSWSLHLVTNLTLFIYIIPDNVIVR